MLSNDVEMYILQTYVNAEEMHSRVEFGYSDIFLFGFSAVCSLIFGYSVKVRLETND